jgi:hypothetical protein
MIILISINTMNAPPKIRLIIHHFSLLVIHPKITADMPIIKAAAIA